MNAKLRTDLAARLSALPALASVGVVWQPAPIGQPASLLVLRMISDIRDLSHGGDTGLREARVQADAYAVDPADAEEIRDAVLDSLHGFKGELITGGESIDSCAHDGSFEDFDEAAGLNRASCDLKMQYHISAS